MKKNTTTNKKAAQNTTANKKRVVRVKKHLSKKDIEYFRQLLLDKMQEIIGDVAFIEGEALKKSRSDAAGDLSSMPIHMADIGTDNYEQAFALDLLDSERKILDDVVWALGRIDEKSYGVCEVTGRPIPKARLEAKPWARYCVEYVRLVEKGVVTRGEPLPDGVELD